jgi:hypothetical protein
MARTVVTWNPIPSEQIRTEFRQIASDWAIQGRTNGQFLADPAEVPATGPYVVTREFTTLADAQAWMDEVVLPRATPENYEVAEA